MPETAILLQKSIGGIKGARRAQGRAEGRKGGQEGRQGGQEGRSALLFWPSWNTAPVPNFIEIYMYIVVLCQVGVTRNKRRGIGIPELHDHAERHSAFNTSSK